MGRIRDYFDLDFGHCIRLDCSIAFQGEQIETAILYDPSAHGMFVACFVGAGRDYPYLEGFLGCFEGGAKLNVSGHITLPSAKQFPGEIRVENKTELEVLYRFFGDPDWRSTRDLVR